MATLKKKEGTKEKEMKPKLKTDRVRVDPAAWLSSTDGRRIMIEALKKLDASEDSLDRKRYPWRYLAAQIPDFLKKCEFDLEFALWSLEKYMAGKSKEI